MMTKIANLYTLYISLYIYIYEISKESVHVQKNNNIEVCALKQSEINVLADFSLGKGS